MMGKVKEKKRTTEDVRALKKWEGMGSRAQ